MTDVFVTKPVISAIVYDDHESYCMWLNWSWKLLSKVSLKVMVLFFNCPWKPLSKLAVKAVVGDRMVTKAIFRTGFENFGMWLNFQNWFWKLWYVTELAMKAVVCDYTGHKSCGLWLNQPGKV